MGGLPESQNKKRPKALTLSLFINGGPSVSQTQHPRIMSTDFFCGRHPVSGLAITFRHFFAYRQTR